MSAGDKKAPLPTSLVLASAKVAATGDAASIGFMREAMYAAEHGYDTVPRALARVVRALTMEPHERYAERWEAVAAVALAAKEAAS